MMNQDSAYFFCGIGGSGMLPLALIVQARGHEVAGSDRALDQGRTAPKFAFLRDHGIRLFPQDGSGITSANQIVVASAAVEDTVPDIVAARRVGATTVTRAALLANLFNAAPVSIGVAGTSGKSTTTGMIGWILHCAGLEPTVMNGAVMKNFVTTDVTFASAVVGQGEIFVSEVDESDGSIAHYTPTIAVVNNIALDHKTLSELRALFNAFVGRARTAVLNLDNAETRAIAQSPAETCTFGLADSTADFFGTILSQSLDGIAFEVLERASGVRAEVRLKVPGRHNVQNALAAIAAARCAGVSLATSAGALSRFEGLKRRYDLVGTVHGVTVIDDFAHNPDKIAATLAAAHVFPGRLLLLFQPHGYGPLKLMKEPLVEAFVSGMTADDVLVMPQPVYYGGTTERSVGSEDVVAGVIARGRDARFVADRAACGEELVRIARSGDRIVIMGARDDTLSTFASELLQALSSPALREGGGTSAATCRRG
jgi:UDP-N-acetylmuramate--alanine ligase